jgi:molybdopterin-containing oxidoreductase family iron-sulfur binding subunit
MFFCVQKLQAAKLDAKKDNRMLNDGDAKTACMTACATGAIVFGNIHDKTSKVYKVRDENKQRSFDVLEQLHVLPNVSYLAKIRNTEEEDSHWGGGHGAEHQATGDHKDAGHGEHKADSILPSAVKPEETHH